MEKTREMPQWEEERQCIMKLLQRGKTALNNKLCRKDVNSRWEREEKRKNKTKEQNQRKKDQHARTNQLNQWQSMTNHQHTTRILRTAPDSGKKNSKGSRQTYRIQFMGNTTSKHRVGQQRERTHSLTSQTVMFTLLKCTGSCDLQNKHPQFNSDFFPMQTIIAHIAQNMNYLWYWTLYKDMY